MTDDLRAFYAPEGWVEDPNVFGVYTCNWGRAAQEAGSWYTGIVEGAEKLVKEWRLKKTEKERARHEKMARVLRKSIDH